MVVCLVATAVVLGVATGGCRHANRAVVRPDVLLIVVDTLRADHLQTYGYTRPTSPRIDALAHRATVFDAAITPAPLTMPAVASLMTGHYPDRIGIINHSPRDRLVTPLPTLAERAARAGYTTAAVVVNPWLARRTSGFARGFDRFIVHPGKHRGRPNARQVTRAALRLLRLKHPGPIFLWVHYMDVHMPYRPPARFVRKVGGKHMTTSVIDDFVRPGSDRQTIYFDPRYSPDEIEATARLYDGAIRYVDSQVARLLAAWRQRTEARRSVTILTADHGESLGEHGLFFAHDFTLYDELVHVPLIVRAPGIVADRISSVVSLVDIVPTMCRLMSLACTDRFDGISLPLDSRPRFGVREVFAASAPMRQRYDRCPWLTVPGPEGRWTMARTDTRKLIRLPTPEGVRYLAFDLTRDPDERVNVYEEAESRVLQTKLQAWQAAVRKDSAPRPPPSRLDPRTRADLRALGYLD